jgi:parallel beta-helix repeat protein
MASMHHASTRRALFERFEERLALATYYVASLGSDTQAGSADAPWATLQKAADTVNPGDTVVARAGTYSGFDLRRDGTALNRIVFSAEPGVIVNSRNLRTPDGINLEGADYVTIEGFTVSSVPRAGIRSVTNDGVILRNNRCDQNGRWGILTGFSENILIENNECSRSADEHGIYVSNSADNPIIRGNVVWGNFANGIHMNGDVFTGEGDGIISGALVENNVIFDNGTGGGSGINCDGVQTSRIQNNLLYDNHASGISLYRIDGGGGSTGNVVVNNTILQAADGRWAINIADGSTGNTILNNVLFNAHPFRGSITVENDSLVGLVSDYNAVIDRFSSDGGTSRITLAQWRAWTGQDQHSILATPGELFVAPNANNYQLNPGSPAIDRGTALLSPNRDLAGNPRPSGSSVDIGAYERASTGLASAGNDVIYVTASADGTQLELYNSNPPFGLPLLVWPMSSTSPLSLDTLTGDDELIVQLPAGASGPPGGILYQAGSGMNRLQLLSGTIRLDSTASGGTLNTTVAMGAQLLTGRLTQNGLTLENNSRVTLLPSGETSVITSLSLGTGATLEIGNNALVIDYSGASPVETVREKTLSGRGGPGLGASWTGMGITSNAVAQANQAEPESRSVGYAENALLPLGPYTAFRGVPVDDTAVLIAFTPTGDANLDGLVNDDDVTIVGATYAPGVSQPHWPRGDFDYNGFVDDDDVTLLGVFYEPSANPQVLPPAALGKGFRDSNAKDELIDLLAESIAADGQAQSAGLANRRVLSERAQVSDSLMAEGEKRVP